jgi:hypothetical protein
MNRIPPIRISLWILMAIALLGTSVGSLRADPVTIHFTGTVDSVPASVSSYISNGDTLSGSYAFDSATAANSGSTSTFAVFDALTSFSFALDSFSGSSSAAAEIQVDNNPPSPNDDRYGLLSRVSDGLVMNYPPGYSGATVTDFSFRLDDSTDAVFSDALNLPTEISLSTFDSSQFFLFLNDGTLVHGVMTSVSSVPEPSTALLLGLAFLGTIAVSQFRGRLRVRRPGTSQGDW